MFDRPEELIMTVLAAVWVIMTYFAAAYLGADLKSTLMITGLTLVWAVIAFVLWQAGRAAVLWPVLLGLLLACWWPYLDWMVIRSAIPEGTASGDVIIVKRPWYATWTFKLVLSALPVIGGYLWKWQQSRKRKAAGLV